MRERHQKIRPYRLSSYKVEIARDGHSPRITQSTLVETLMARAGSARERKHFDYPHCCSDLLSFMIVSLIRSNVIPDG